VKTESPFLKKQSSNISAMLPQITFYSLCKISGATTATLQARMFADGLF
jgi:hypothetical protein